MERAWTFCWIIHFVIHGERNITVVISDIRVEILIEKNIYDFKWVKKKKNWNKAQTEVK